MDPYCLLIIFRVADPHHFNADPDPALYQSDANLQSLVYRQTLHGSIFNP
jgi:hypothetical protein